MSIDIVALRDNSSKIIGYSIVIEEESIPGFKEMVNRAFNCWADAPPELKSFADKVTHGKVLQNYFEQSKLTPSYDKNKDIESEGQRATITRLNPHEDSPLAGMVTPGANIKDMLDKFA